MSVNPSFCGQVFLTSTLGKIKILRSQLDCTGLDVEIQANRGIVADNIGEVAAAGRDVIVSGSGVFGTIDYAKTIALMKQNLHKAVSEKK